MRRRKFVTLLGGAVAWPFAARAQQPAGGKPLLGVLMAGVESTPDNQKRIAAFRQGLAEFGWIDGDNIRIEYRWSTGTEELIRKYAEELVALAPNVILANSTPVIAEFKSITTTIPIVFALSIDPVGLGFVTSLARPGGNITGFSFIDPELIGKWMQLLKDVTPRTTRAALLFNPGTTPVYLKFVREIGAARQSGSIELVAMSAGTDSEMEAAIKTLVQTPGSALIVPPDPFVQVHIKKIAQLAAQYRLPLSSVYRPFVVEGGLMAYGPDTADIFRRTAAYVDRILKGAKPADLPVQQPVKFESIFNLKTPRRWVLPSRQRSPKS